MKVSECMTRSAVTCRPDDNDADAARLLWEHDCGALPVVDGEEHVVGMVTDRDLCMGAYTRGESFGSLRVRDSMSRELHHCRSSDSLEEALDLMARHQIRRLPVLDENRRLAGILSMNDVARCVLAVPNLAHKQALTMAALQTLAAIGEPHGARPRSAADRASTDRTRDDSRRGARGERSLSA